MGLILQIVIVSTIFSGTCYLLGVNGQSMFADPDFGGEVVGRRMDNPWAVTGRKKEWPSPGDRPPYPPRPPVNVPTVPKPKPKPRPDHRPPVFVGCCPCGYSRCCGSQCHGK